MYHILFPIPPLKDSLCFFVVLCYYQKLGKEKNWANFCQCIYGIDSHIRTVRSKGKWICNFAGYCKVFLYKDYTIKISIIKKYPLPITQRRQTFGFLTIWLSQYRFNLHFSYGQDCILFIRLKAICISFSLNSLVIS